MPFKTSIISRWQSASAMLLPVVLVLVVTAASVLTFVLWSAISIDESALERQRSIASRAIEGHKGDLLRDLKSIFIPDRVLTNTQLPSNIEWMEDNIGAWMHEFHGVDGIVVFSGNNAPVYLMNDGISVTATRLEPASDPFLPILSRIRAIRPAQTFSGALALPATISDYAIIGGQPAAIAATTIVSNSGAPPRPGFAEPVVIAVKLLDAITARSFNRQYLFEGGRFTLVDSNDPSRAVHPILNAAGRFIAFFDWERERPGRAMLQQAGTAMIAGLVVTALLIVLLFRMLFRSTAAIKAGQRQAEHQAAHDPLTGLPNRTSFDATLAQALTEGDWRNSRLTLYMLDLDRFKQVNDTLGHQAGDALICAVGDRLRAIFGSGATIARLGGDEFSILTIDQDKPVDVMEVSARVIESIGRSFELGRFKAHVGVSIGIVMAHGGSTEHGELVRKADIALYEAKAGGRNRAVVYEEHMNELLQLQHTIEAEMREALGRDDQLSIVFQPLVDQKSRRIIGAEALARWHHPKYGQISPARFIPVAENTGLIEALGDFVLRRACELGATVPGRTIAVNISPTQLRNPQFALQVFDTLQQTGMRAHDLELEITESILLDDEHISSQNLRAFRAAGIHIALDDFGTGYSSLSYLQRYPVDRIKIDRSFVNQLADGHVTVAITNAIVTLAHAMALEVTAEGVETEEQATILGTLGCNTLQGFLFSGGVSADRITELFSLPRNTLVEPRRRRQTHANASASAKSY